MNNMDNFDNNIRKRMKEDSIAIRAANKFNQETEDIIRRRFELGKDIGIKPQSKERITAAIVRHNFWPRIKNDIINAELKPLRSFHKDKRGSLNELFGSAMALILVCVIGIIFVVLGAIVLYGFGTITNGLVNLPATSNVTNVSQYAATTFGNIDIGLNSLQWISTLLIFGMFIAIFMSYFLVKIHPAYFIFYIIMVSIAIVFSIFLSRTYENLYNDSGILGTALHGFSSSSYILLYLPIWITVIGIIGGIFLFVTFNRDYSQGSMI